MVDLPFKHLSLVKQCERLTILDSFRFLIMHDDGMHMGNVCGNVAVFGILESACHL